MTYNELLATLPASVWGNASQWADGECLTCESEGFCRDRAESLVSDIAHHLRVEHGVNPDNTAILQWLLANDEIGMDKDENVAELAQRYIAEVQP